MIKYFKTFFYPQALTYTYNLPKELVIVRIEKVLQNKVTFFGSNDMTGRFLSVDSFAIEVISPVYTRGVKFGSTLVGEIIESQKGSTKIKTKVKPSIAFYPMFFLAIVFGLVCLYQFVITGSVSILFWSLAMLIIGPALSIGFSNIAIASVRERYKMYIDKELRPGL